MSTLPATESFVDILHETTFGDVWYCVKAFPSFILHSVFGVIFFVFVLFIESARLGRDCWTMDDDEEKALGSASGVAAGAKGGDDSGEKMRVEGGSSNGSQSG